MTAVMYRFPMHWIVGGDQWGASISVDDTLLWAGPEDDIRFHVDVHRQLWAFPLKSSAAVLVTALYPEAADRIQELADRMVVDRAQRARQLTREIHDTITEQLLEVEETGANEQD